jgi:hypothetical protein
MLTGEELTTCGRFVGAWLLVAGPMFQGALELRAEDIDREVIQRVARSIPARQRVSSWWWLFPPVLYALYWQNTIRHRKEMFAAMTTEQREKALRYMNKATGWFLVSGGGLLLACAETRELIKLYALPSWSFWILGAAMLAGCALNTTFRMVHTDRLVNLAPKRPDEPGASIG